MFPQRKENPSECGVWYPSNIKSQSGKSITERASCSDFIRQFVYSEENLPKLTSDRCYSQKCFIKSQHLEDIPTESSSQQHKLWHLGG